MSVYDTAGSFLRDKPKSWLVTGVAGFIGSNILQELLRLNQRVVGLDNFVTGSKSNLQEVQSSVGDAWKNFTFMEGDIRQLTTCVSAAHRVDYVLHQAALGSVPLSIEKPLDSHEINLTGFVNVLLASRDQKVKRVVYASSSAVYGDAPGLPKTEASIGNCLSPYAATKLANEIYADAFSRSYGIETVGLRYFNVFGPRQDPNGPYAAVIPKWIQALIQGQEVFINGDGETTRDFCYVANVVQANILAATVANPAAVNQVYNVAVHARTTLNELFETLRSGLLPDYPAMANARPVYRDFRPGDVRHSEADISKARNLLGYAPTHTLHQGLAEALPWYRANLPGTAAS